MQSDVRANPIPDAIWLADAYPRMIRGTFEIRIYEAQTATQGFRTLDVVDVQGRTIESLAHRVQLIPGLQTFTVDASTWSTGMYFVVVSDYGSRAGTIKILKIS
ncbi:MAG: T9SS type A sorting domain-containing protein [bacterium]|nr:T9SS type A sorting domain-containing protein [bacterium]